MRSARTRKYPSPLRTRDNPVLAHPVRVAGPALTVPPRERAPGPARTQPPGLLQWVFARLNRRWPWHRLPLPLALCSLHAMGRCARRASGVAGWRAARERPSPESLSAGLLRRRRFTPAPGLNLLAAAWHGLQWREAHAPERIPAPAGPACPPSDWVGPLLVQELLALEHRAIYAYLRGQRPQLGHEALHAMAGRIVACVRAAIHAEWCAALIPHRALGMLMRCGPIAAAAHGLDPAVRAAHCSLAALLPDAIDLHSVITGSRLGPSCGYPLAELRGARARALLDEYRLPHLWYSFGVAAAGAVRLGNFPPGPCTGAHAAATDVDRAAASIARQRAAGVAPFNALRRCLGLHPLGAIGEFDPHWVATLGRLYADVECVDLLIGLLAERRPRAHALGETTMPLLLLSAPDAPGIAGLDHLGRAWLAQASLRQVLLRHYPSLQDALYGVGNPFTPWRRIRLLL